MSTAGDNPGNPVPPHGGAARDPWLISLILVWALVLARGGGLAPGHQDARPPESALSTIDPNTAPWWELTVLPRVGDQLARRIVAFREAASAPPGSQPPPVVFHSADDMALVHGIGPKTVERIRPHLRFEEALRRPDP